jgi:hypothetical protein
LQIRQVRLLIFGHESHYWQYSQNAEIDFSLSDNRAAKNILQIEHRILGWVLWRNGFVFNNSFDDKRVLFYWSLRICTFPPEIDVIHLFHTSLPVLLISDIHTDENYLKYPTLK